jgi:hypothetical protein
MRKHKLLVAIATVLGISTLWLALELHQARQEVAELRGAAAGAPAGEPVSPNAKTQARGSQTAPAATASSTAAVEPSTETAASHDAAAMRAANFAHNAWVRTWLDDPAKRAKVYADMRRAQQQDAPREMLDVDDDTYERFLDSQAEGGLRHAEAMYRCNTDPRCDIQGAIAEQAQLRQRELADVLGQEKARRLETYRDNVMERNSVTHFNNELPDALKLSTAQADNLTNALGEERRRIVNEWQQRGEQIAGIANAWGALNYPQMKNIEERTVEAAEFQRRQRGRAAGILTPEQLSAFTKQQEQMLEIMRGSWEFETQERNQR